MSRASYSWRGTFFDLAATVEYSGSAAADLPIYLYNFPKTVERALSPELIDRLIEAFGSRIAGLKDSSCDLDYCRAQAARSGFDVFPATETSLVAGRSGAFAGCISATVNLTCTDAAAAWRNGDTAAEARAEVVRARLQRERLVPAVKLALAHRLNMPGLARVMPPYA